MSQSLLEVKNVCASYGSKKKKILKNINLSIDQKETVSLVGISGCGKSTLAKVIMHMLPVDSGEIIFNGMKFNELSNKVLRSKRPDLQMIFQDSYSSLNPKKKVADILMEAIQSRGDFEGDLMNQVIQLLESVYLKETDTSKFPRQLSGGQRQRVAIARALATKPKLIVCDESLAAVDIIVQKDIIKLFEKLQEQYNHSYLFISHDLSVVRRISDKVAIMSKGEIVELGTPNQIFQDPKSKHTRQLIESILTI